MIGLELNICRYDLNNVGGNEVGLIGSCYGCLRLIFLAGFPCLLIFAATLAISLVWVLLGLFPSTTNLQLDLN